MTNKRKARVLAIDDEATMLEWLKTILENDGYEVRAAMNAARGEELHGISPLSFCQSLPGSRNGFPRQRAIDRDRLERDDFTLVRHPAAGS